MSAPMTDPRMINAFMHAGKAVFTVVSRKTGTRFTYRVRKADRPDFFFVDLLTGPENTADYAFIGTIGRRLQGDGCWAFQYSHRADSYSHENAPSVVAISWLVERLNYVGRPLDPAQIEFWHAGTCARCGRDLTDPESIETGLGPVCREKANGVSFAASCPTGTGRGANPRNYVKRGA